MNFIKDKINLLHTPHPFIFNNYSVIIPCIVTILIITILAPQKFQEIPFFQRSFYALLIGLLVSATIYLSVRYLRQLFPNFAHEDNWTLGKEVLLYLMVTMLINVVIFVVISAFYSGTASIFQRFLKTTLYTLGISIFPITVLVLYEQYSYQKTQFKRASQLTKALESEKLKLQGGQIKNPSLTNQIQIRAENGNIEMQLTNEELLCIKSDGNYVEIYSMTSGGPQVKLIRNKLKSLEHILPKNHFFRCHNRFIVNVKHIVEVEGNARNLELWVRNLDFKIPVSRAKATTLVKFLNTLS